ncbi:MAG: HDOD domain-containing protein [Opitutae bacterium]|nr:HDOD domain-containing protein [Opitutae bacterium]
MPLSRETIITLGTALPPALGVFGRLQASLRQADTGLDEIVDLVRVDPSLTFQTIRLANSAFFGLKQQCESLAEAVARVGFGDIHRLVGLAVGRQVFQGDLNQYQISGARLWENAVAVSAVASALAARAGGDQQSAAATGMLRNLGKVVLNNHHGAITFPGELTEPDVAAWEQRIYGATAGEVTAVLLGHWRFSADTVGAVRGHRDPAAAPEALASAARLHLACAVVAAWGHHLPGEARGWRTDAARCAEAGVDEAGLQAATAEAREQFARLAQLDVSCAA